PGGIGKTPSRPATLSGSSRMAYSAAAGKNQACAMVGRGRCMVMSAAGPAYAAQIAAEELQLITGLSCLATQRAAIGTVFGNEHWLALAAHQLVSGAFAIAVAAFVDGKVEGLMQLIQQFDGILQADRQVAGMRLLGQPAVEQQLLAARERQSVAV